MDGLTVNVDRVLRIGQLVRLSLLEGDVSPGTGLSSVDETQTYPSHIEDLLPESVVVAWPTDKGIQVPAAIGQSITLRIPFDRGVLQLDSIVSARTKEPIPLFYVDRAGDWSRTQMRLHVRLYVVIVPHEALLVLSGQEEGAARILSNADKVLQALKKGLLREEPFDATIQNLSAGGMLLGSASPLENGSLLRIRFPLAKSQPDIIALAKVIWVEEETEKKEHRFRAGCQFVSLGAKQQDIITRFIFAKQVELRQRGLL